MEAPRKLAAMLVALLLVAIPTVRLAHAAGQHEEIVSKLPSLEGRTVYASGFFRLYEASSTFEDMQQNLTPKRYLTGWEALDDFCRDRMCRSRRIPLLAPLRIVEVDYVPGHDALIFKLQTQNGIDVISLTTAETLANASYGNDLLGQVCGLLLPDLPKNLSAREIIAVQKRKLFPGISERAITDMGRQLVYSDSLVVFLNAEGRLVQLRTPGVAQSGDSSNQIKKSFR